MTIDWSAFSPLTALLGGLLIGLSTALYLLGAGRIAGISGIVGGALDALAQRRPLAPQRSSLSFIAGLLAAPWLWRLAVSPPASAAPVGWTTTLAAGLLVGFGVRMAQGCTSGHGVCGLARRSPRSLANVLVFMATGFATVFVVRHLLGVNA